MSIILHISTLFLFILSFSHPVCFDRIINGNNINEEFLIDNVDGIGLLKITDNFKRALKTTTKSETANGKDIFFGFLIYASADVDHISRCIMNYLIINMQYPNLQVDSLCEYHKLLLEIVQNIKF